MLKTRVETQLKKVPSVFINIFEIMFSYSNNGAKENVQRKCNITIVYNISSTMKEDSGHLALSYTILPITSTSNVDFDPQFYFEINY